jgi:hypothetical protein
MSNLDLSNATTAVTNEEVKQANTVLGGDVVASSSCERDDCHW